MKLLVNICQKFQETSEKPQSTRSKGREQRKYINFEIMPVHFMLRAGN